MAGDEVGRNGVMEGEAKIEWMCIHHVLIMLIRTYMVSAGCY